MKKFFRTLAAFVCFVAIVLAGCEKPDGSICLSWSMACLAVALVAGFLFKKIGGDEVRG